MKLCFLSIATYYLLTVFAEWHGFGSFLAPNDCSDCKDSERQWDLRDCVPNIKKNMIYTSKIPVEMAVAVTCVWENTSA